MVDFKTLKKNSGKNSLEKLTEAASKLANPQNSFPTDDRFWYPNTDKAGNGYAVIRFLPPKGDDEDMPFVRIFSHVFKGPTGLWYIENSLTTLGKDDPVSEYNSQLWNSGLESNKEIARKQKRKLTFVSNVYIIEDQANPENVEKVKLFRYGKKLFDKLNEAMNPEFEDEEAVNPFDLWEGANFKLKIRNVEGYRNYDKSEFAKVGPLFKEDAKMEEVWNQCHSLQELLAEKNFKSYDELKKQLHKVLGLNENPAKSTTNVEETKAPRELPKAEVDEPPFDTPDDDEDGSLEFFQNLIDKD